MYVLAQPMLSVMPIELTQQCNDAIRTGADFPSIWHTIIKGHAAVIGLPVQRMDGAGRPFVEVPLTGGQWLVVNHDHRIVTLR